MVSRRRNAMTTQTLWRSREPVLVLCRVLMSGQPQPLLLLRRPDARLQFLEYTHWALAVDARRVRKDIMGPYTPLRFVDVEPWLSLKPTTNQTSWPYIIDSDKKVNSHIESVITSDNCHSKNMTKTTHV